MKINNTITTPSGTYTIKEYKEIENKVKQAFKDFWHKKITMEEHRKIIKSSGLSHGEISSLQYQASLEDYEGGNENGY